MEKGSRGSFEVARCRTVERRAEVSATFFFLALRKNTHPSGLPHHYSTLLDLLGYTLLIGPRLITLAAHEQRVRAFSKPETPTSTLFHQHRPSRDPPSSRPSESSIMAVLPHPPPPRRTDRSVKPSLPYSSTLPPTNETFKEKAKRKGSQWGTTGVTKVSSEPRSP